MKESRCVRVRRTRGEEIRQQLLELDAVNQDLEIKSMGDHIHIPVHENAEVPDELEVRRDSFDERSTHTSPEDILGYQPGFEVVGDIALIEVEDPEEREKVANAILAADNNVSTVMNIESKVKGQERTRDLRHVAGEQSTEIIHREYGNEFVVDLDDVYFSPRLANERRRVTSKVGEGETVFDMFAGAGPFSIPAAKRGAEVVAVDINPEATEYLQVNAERNGVSERVRVINADARDVAPRVDAERIIMNLPHTADRYLNTAFDAAVNGAVVHYYDIRHEDELFDEVVREIATAADEYGIEIEVVDEVVVRSYAPHEYNICVDFTVREA